jgi:hypothetical protein
MNAFFITTMFADATSVGNQSLIAVQIRTGASSTGRREYC